MDGIKIATLPAGTLILRAATAEDIAIEPSRVLLVQQPGGSPRWVHLSAQYMDGCIVITHDAGCAGPKITIEVAK